MSYYAGRVRQYEANLKSLRNRRATAVKKVNGLEKDIAQLEKQARSAKSDSLRGGYLRRIEGKQRDLGRAREAESKLAIDISTMETKLSDARSKLADAKAAADRQRQRKEEDEHKQRGRETAARARREEAAQRRRERNEARRHDEQAAREAQQERQIDALHTRTTELEAQLAAAERRAAPPEITVLFLASSPQDQTPLRLDRETREIQKRVRAAEHRDSIWFEWRLARQLIDLIQDLNEVRPEIVHFSGHGDADALAFEDSDGHTAELTNEQLGRLLEAAGGQVRLTLFNSCNSAAQATLACNHVELAIGMDASIADEIAQTFAGQFYNSLGFGKSVGEAFRQAVLQIEFAHGQGHDVPKLFAAEEIDPETVVLVNPDAASTSSVAAVNEIRDLNEDADRWLRDRNRELQAALNQKGGELSAAGLLYSGGFLQAQIALKRQALHEYRDEMTRKRRRYRDLCVTLGSEVGLPPLELSEEARRVLADWRSPATLPGSGDTTEVDDPTSETVEPDLSRFEVEGDRCDPARDGDR